MRSLVMVTCASLLTACGAPDDPGVWAPLTVRSVASAGGFLYGGGTFRPKASENGDQGVMVIDAEALFLRDEAVVYPTKDVRRSQLREWNTGTSEVVGGGEGGLIALAAGPSLERLTLQNPKQPQRLDAGADVIGLEGFGALTQLSPQVSALDLSGGTQAKVALLRHDSGAHAEREVPFTGCLPPAWAPGGRLVSLGGCGAPGALQVMVLDASPEALTLGFRAARPAPEVTQASGLGVLEDGTVIILDRGSTGTTPRPAGLQLYRLEANDDLTFLRFLALPAGEVGQRIAASGARLVVFTAKTALLIDPAAPGPEVKVVSRLTSFQGVLDVEPYRSLAEPAGVFFALAMGEQGLGLLEVRGDELVHRGGFSHRWTDDFISVKTSGKY